MEEGYLTILNRLPGLVAYLDRDLRYRFANEAHRGWLGHAPETLIGTPVWSIIAHADRGTVNSEFVRALAGEFRSHDLDLGDRGCHRISYAPDQGPSGHVRGIIVQVTDLSELKQVERNLRQSERTFDRSFENTPIAKAIVALSGVCMRANLSLAELIGYAQKELIGLNLGTLVHPSDVMRSLLPHDATSVGERDGYQVEKRLRHRDGRYVHVLLAVSPIRNDEGEPLHFVVEMIDLTERKALHDRLSAQALTDDLTGLLNRRGFEDALVRAERDQINRPVGVMMIDLDNFKPVNDRYGHAVGDALLVNAAARMKAALRCFDEVARLGGDEFGALLIDADFAVIEALASRVSAILNEPYVIDACTIAVSASVGAACRRGSNPSLRELLVRADRLMYRVKDGGRGHWLIAA